MQLIRNPAISLPAALVVAQCRSASARGSPAPDTVRAAIDDINARTAQPAYRLELPALAGKGTRPGLRSEARIEAERTALPTSRRMRRPTARARR